MSTLKQSDADVKLFGPTDVYYYAIDNRPLRELLKNDQAINTELEDLRTKKREVATFLVESPSQENDVGGLYVAEWGGIVRRVVVSCSQPGTGGTFEVDVKMNGTTVFDTPGDRTLLAYDDSDKVSISINPNVVDTEWPVDSLLTLDLLQVQTGGPRWVRVDVFIETTLIDSSAWDFD